MNRKQNFIAIFAIALMAIGANLLTSCNADDEEYDFNGVYTMANGMKTRSEDAYNGQEGLEKYKKDITEEIAFVSEKDSLQDPISCYVNMTIHFTRYTPALCKVEYKGHEDSEFFDMKITKPTVAPLAYSDNVNIDIKLEAKRIKKEPGMPDDTLEYKSEFKRNYRLSTFEVEY